MLAHMSKPRQTTTKKSPLYYAKSCSDCGMTLAAAWRFCPLCGKRLKKPQTN